MRKKIRFWWLRVIFRIIRLMFRIKRTRDIPYAVLKNGVWKVYLPGRGTYYSSNTGKQYTWWSADGEPPWPETVSECTHVANAAGLKKVMDKKLMLDK